MTDKKKPNNPPKKPSLKDIFTGESGDIPKKNNSFVRQPNQITDQATGRTVLMDAIIKNDMARVEALLKSGANVELATKDGKTALQFAAHHGRITAIELLAKYGASINSRDKKNRTALFDALSAANAAEVVKALVRVGADTSLQDKDGRIALHVAAEESKPAVVASLLALTANPSCPDKDGNHPFHLACQSNTSATVKLFIEHPVTVEIANNKGNTGLHLACARASSDVADYLLKTDAVQLVNAVNLDGSTTLHMAAAAEQKSPLIQKLINAGANVNAIDNEGKSALHEAARTHNLTLAKQLINNGADVGKDAKPGSNTALHTAIRGGFTSLAMIELLISNNANLNARDKKGITPLMLAAERGFDFLCQRLLEAGADPSIRDVDGKNVLGYVSQVSKEPVIRALITAGADINQAETNSQRTPLMLALMDHKPELARILIELGADVNKASAAGSTALHFAIRYDNEGLSLQLIQKGADVNATEMHSKLTPLMLATAQGFISTTKAILAKKPPIDQEDYIGRTALAYALMNGLSSMEILNDLVKAGADPLKADQKGTTPYDYAFGDNRTLAIAVFDQVIKKQNRSYTPKRPPWRGWYGYP